jgi:hypothetical protein
MVQSRPHHLSNLTKFEEGLTLFFLFSSWFSSFFFLSRFPALFFLSSRQLSNLLSRSHLSLTRSQGTLYWFGLGFCCERGREERHAAAVLGRGWIILSLSSLYLYSHEMRWVVWGLV